MNKKITLITNIIILLLFSTLILFGFDNMSVSALKTIKNEPIYKGNPNSNYVSLMINVYWGTEYIEDMLNVLDEYGAQATFFIGGTWADDNNALLELIYAQGHEIGNHGYFHKDHKNISYKNNYDEIYATEKLIEAIIGYKTRLFAPPSGSMGANMFKVTEELDYKVIMWSRDTIDWRDKNATLIYERATKNITGGDLILMHPTAETLKALPNILRYYKNNDLKAVSVSENIFY